MQIRVSHGILVYDVIRHREFEAIIVSSQLQLRRVRAMLGLSQTKLAELSGLSPQTVLDAERGKRQIRLTSAYAILRVLNDLRRQQGLPELDLDSLDWNVEE